MVGQMLTLNWLSISLNQKICKDGEAGITEFTVSPNRSQFLLSVVVVLYTVIVNIELANTELVILEEIQIRIPGRLLSFL